MAQVTFTTHLEKYVDCPPSNVQGATLREALDAVFAENPRLRGYILDEQAALRKHVVVFVDGRMVQDRHRLTDPITDASDVYVLQALSGG